MYGSNVPILFQLCYGAFARLCLMVNENDGMREGGGLSCHAAFAPAPAAGVMRPEGDANGHRKLRQLYPPKAPARVCDTHRPQRSFRELKRVAELLESGCSGSDRIRA